MAKRTTTTRKKKKATGQKISYELIGVLFLFSAALGIGQLGFAGIALANFFRFFVGETYPVSLALFGAYGLYLILRGKEPKIRKNWLISGILLYSAALLYLHSQAFETVVTEGASIVSVTLARFLTDVRQADTASEMGGGLIGQPFIPEPIFWFHNGALTSSSACLYFLVRRSYSASRRMMSWKSCAKLP